MKASRWFTVLMLLFLLLTFSIQYHMPKSFVWIPTFSHTDYQPFGCALFDSLLSASLPNGYALTQKTLYQLQEDSIEKRSILMVAHRLHLSQSDVNALLTLADRGNQLMLVSTIFSKPLEDTLHFYCTYSYFQAQAFQRYVSAMLQKDSVYWRADSVYNRQGYQWYPSLCSSCFRATDSLQLHSLVEKSSADVLAMVYPRGKGSITFVSTPLLFTNYGVMDDATVHYLFRLLTPLSRYPVWRTEGYSRVTAQVEQSPFRYLLAHRPLRWALYLTLLTLLLFLLFTAKRKQRVIPVINEPQNRSLAFVKQIGTLYFQRKNHTDLVRKKFQFLSEELRRERNLEVEHPDHRLEKYIDFFNELRVILEEDRPLSEEKMKLYIDKMNEISHQLLGRPTDVYREK